MASDNIAGKKYTGFLKLYMFPGQVIQWFMYMGTAGMKGYGKVRAETRLARSPLMTAVYSTVFWFLIAYLLFDYFTRGSEAVLIKLLSRL